MTKKNKEEKIYEIDKEALHKVIDHYVEAKNAKIKMMKLLIYLNQ